MLVSSKQMILLAQEYGYGVGCFNTSNLEITKAIITAAEAQKSPVIISTSEKAIEYAGLETLAAIIKEEAEKSSVPVALHLDHGKSLEMIQKCLDVGYTSVMFDGSSFDFEANKNLTAKAAILAHSKNIPCEGELGALGKAGQSVGHLTDPGEVGEFTQNAGVDFLAVSIGSEHGHGENETLNIELLKRIRAATPIALVLHGASGVSDQDIRQAIESGISKINIDTDIRHTFSTAMRNITQSFPEMNDSKEIMTKVMAEIQKLVEQKIQLFGSSGKS